MRPVDEWLNKYAVNHRNPTNVAVHWVCVPLIVLSVVGLLASLPVPRVFTEIAPILDWGTLFLMASVVYYFVLSAPLAIGMLVFIAALILLLHWLEGAVPSLALFSASVFVLAWIGQFIGHQIEGSRPSFLQDLQFLMIGPLWLLAKLYRRLDIRY